MSFYKFANMTEQEQIELLKYTFQEFDTKLDVHGFYLALLGNIQHIDLVKKRISSKSSLTQEEAARLDKFLAANLNPKARKATKKRDIIRIKYMPIIESLLKQGYGWRKIHEYIIAQENEDFISFTGLKYIYEKLVKYGKSKTY